MANTLIYGPRGSGKNIRASDDFAVMGFPCRCRSLAELSKRPFEKFGDCVESGLCMSMVYHTGESRVVVNFACNPMMPHVQISEEQFGRLTTDVKLREKVLGPEFKRTWDEEITEEMFAYRRPTRMIVLDEMGVKADSHVSSSKHNRAMVYTVNESRKLDIELKNISQLRRAVEVRIREQTDVFVECKALYTPSGRCEGFLYDITTPDATWLEFISVQEAVKIAYLYDTRAVFEPTYNMEMPIPVLAPTPSVR